MKRIFGVVIVGAIAGLVVGYFIFGDVAGVRLSVSDLLPVSGGGFGAGLGRFAQNVAGISEIRRNILLTGAAGAGLAVVASVFSRRR